MSNQENDNNKTPSNGKSEKSDIENAKGFEQAPEGEKKISALLLEMVYPLITPDLNQEQIKGILTLGILSWNLGVVKTQQNEVAYNKLMDKFQLDKMPEYKKLLEKYIDIKCDKYGDYVHYITKYNMDFKDGELDFSVEAKVIEGGFPFMP